MYSFQEFICETKDYPLYRGYNVEGCLAVLKSGYINATGKFDSPLRQIITDKKVISVTRNKQYVTQVGSCIFIIDTKKLSSKYKIKPFIENLDYYLDLSEIEKKKGVEEKTGKVDISGLKKMIRMKEYGYLAWRTKTDKNFFDHGIDEELVIADKFSIKNYVKEFVYIGYASDNELNKYQSKVDYWKAHKVIATNSEMREIKKYLDDLGIPNNLVYDKKES